MSGAASSAEGGRQTSKGRATRERLLEAASELFALKGFDGTSVEAVADAAGITVPGMYRHFATKHELLLHVARWATRTSRARQELLLSQELSDGLAGLFEEYLADGEIARRRLSVELSRAAFHDPDLGRSVAQFNQLLRASLAETLAERGGAAEDEAALLSHLALVLLMGAIHLDTLDSDRIGDAALIDYLRRRFATILSDPGEPRRDDRPLPPTMVEVDMEEPADGRRARTVRTRRRIVASARELFALRGYDATTIEAIATEAGITVPGLYRHVPSKESLLVEVARTAYSGYQLGTHFPDGVPVADQLADLLAAFSRGADRVTRRLTVELDFGAWRSPVLASDLQGFHRGVRRSVARAIAGEGTEITEEHDLAALVYLMLFMGVAHLDTVDPYLIDDPAWVGLLGRRVPQLVAVP